MLFPSTDDKCPNTLTGKHYTRHNARETHYVCNYCCRLLGEIPLEKRKPIPAWRNIY